MSNMNKFDIRACLPFSLELVFALLLFDVSQLLNVFEVVVLVFLLLLAVSFSLEASGSPSLPTAQETISIGGNSYKRIPTCSTV